MSAKPFVAILLVLVACRKEAIVPDGASERARVDLADTGGRMTLEVVDGAAAPSLGFEIVKVHERQKAGGAPPFHVDGGEWTFFDAKLADGIGFTVGVYEQEKRQSHLPIKYGGAMLVVPSHADGEKLALAYAKAFNAKAPTAGKSGEHVVPLFLRTVILGQNVSRFPDGSLGGEGTWTANKWTIARPDHEAEVYFNFSLEEKKGEWSQKAADYDREVAQDFMDVLHGGVLEKPM